MSKVLYPIVQVALLLAGAYGSVSQKFPFLGALLLLLDGYFHLSVSEERMMRESPDWVFMQRVFNKKALPLGVHRVMGAVFMAVAVYVLHGLTQVPCQGQPNKLMQNLNRYFIPPILVGIALVIILKAFAKGRDKDQVAFF